MENTSDIKRSELFYKILEKVKQLPRAQVDGDAVDHPSLSVTLEELFLQEMEERKIGNSIKGPYYIEAKIVSGGMMPYNTNIDLVREFEKHGFKFKGEPITQDNGEVCWTFMEKNNGLVTESQDEKSS